MTTKHSKTSTLNRTYECANVKVFSSAPIVEQKSSPDDEPEFEWNEKLQVSALFDPIRI